MGGVRRFARLVGRGVRRLGIGANGCVPAICYRRIVAATGVAMVGGLPRLDPRESKVCRSHQGDGERATTTRSSPGIAAGSGIVYLAGERDCLRRVWDRAL